MQQPKPYSLNTSKAVRRIQVGKTEYHLPKGLPKKHKKISKTAVAVWAFVLIMMFTTATVFITFLIRLFQ